MADNGHKELVSSSRRGFDSILSGDNADLVFADHEDLYFTSSSNVDVLDILPNGQSCLQTELNDEDIRRSIEVPPPSQSPHGACIRI